MKCLMKYDWVKLMRSHLPEGKGLMGQWAKLASSAAFRKGYSSYCGYQNEVEPGMWSGGIVGIKSILGVKNKKLAFEALDKLSELGYLEYTLDEKTKKLTYKITDWVVKCSGAECMTGTVYTTNGYGFLCLPRNITERLAEKHYIFEESDAWLDLWCHTVSNETSNAFSFMAPIIQYGRYGAILTLETLGQRWGWEKTKVWRFIKKYGDVFTLYRLPGNYGCLIFNKLYPTGTDVSLPTSEKIVSIFEEIRILSANTQKVNSEIKHINKMIAWYSKQIIYKIIEVSPENRVALSDTIIRTYLSPCKNCMNCKYDCIDNILNSYTVNSANNIRGPSMPIDLTKNFSKEIYTYE